MLVFFINVKAVELMVSQFMWFWNRRGIRQENKNKGSIIVYTHLTKNICMTQTLYRINGDFLGVEELI